MGAGTWNPSTGWLCFRRMRVHDLKHAFGHRLRAAGVSFEDRQDLLGHKSRRITTHYLEAELANLIAAAEKACDPKSPKSSRSPGQQGHSERKLRLTR
jgi:integrase